MTRIEVLKGPQGTLYGANALGGILKYVTNAPDPSGFSARMESGVSSVDNGGVGYDYHGMVNIPLASDLALRVVGFYNNYPGFIDDPSRDLKDINGSRFSGGRASLLYQPIDDLSVRLNVLYQNRHEDDYGTAAEDVNPVTLTPIHGNLTQERLFAQPVNEFTQLYNLTVLMAEQNFNQAIRIASRGYIIVHGEIVVAANSVDELQSNDIVKRLYLGGAV